MVWDRAVGQMQFLPETWHSVARDGDGDKAMNPDDIDDSALGAAVYLCGVGGSLADPAGVARAAFRYNHSDYYVQLVLSFQSGYQTGVFAVPSPPPPAPKTKAHPRRRSTLPRSRSTPLRSRRTEALVAGQAQHHTQAQADTQAEPGPLGAEAGVRRRHLAGLRGDVLPRYDEPGPGPAERLGGPSERGLRR